MNLIQILRKISLTLKYLEVDKYIGLNIPIRISDLENISSVIESDIIEKLNVSVVNDVNYRMVGGTIAKYGILDITVEIDDEIEFSAINGLQVLRENHLDEHEIMGKSEGFELLEEAIEEVSQKKTFLKIFARAKKHNKDWYEEKSYLMDQFLEGKKLSPLPEDDRQVFEIIDMCYTNYSGIWFWKHFYV